MSGNGSGESPRRDIAWALLVSAAVLAVYGATLCRTIYTGDDGDFITAMATFGVPHPTGYPLFCLLGRLWLFAFPWGSPAFKVNLLTALFGAAAAGMLFRFLALRLAPRGHRSLAACAALLFAFAPTLWQQSLSCEVYSLTALFLATLLFLAARFAEAPRENRRLFALTFAFGLALTNHLTLALLFPAFLAFVLYHRPALLLGRDGRLLLPMAGLFLLPLTLYAYLPLAARSGSAPVNWGLPDTWAAFRAHVTGEAFRHLMFRSADVPLRQGPEYLRLLRAEYGIPLLCLVPVGIAALWRAAAPDDEAPRPRRIDRSLCLLLLAVWLVTVFFAVNYEIFDIYVYYIPSYLAAACLMAFGASALLTFVQDRRRVSAEDRARTRPLIAAVALALPLLQVSLHFVANDVSHNFLEEDFAENVLRSSPPKALIVTSSNVDFTLWYERFVLGQRGDVTTVHRGLLAGLLGGNGWYARLLGRTYPGIADLARGRSAAAVSADLGSGKFLTDLIGQALDRGVPVMLVPDARYDGPPAGAGGGLSFDDRLKAAGFVRVPWGVCDRLFRRGAEPPAARVVAENLAIRAALRFRGVYDGSGTVFQDPEQVNIPRRYLEADAAFAAAAEKIGRYDVAIDALERARTLNDWPELRAAEERCRALAAANGLRRIDTPPAAP